MGWLYILVVALNTLLMCQIMSLPLMEERSTMHEDVKVWDKPIMAFVAWIGPLLTLLTAGLDRRFGWSVPLPMAARAGCFLVIVLGMALSDWAISVNQYFSAVVRIQKERGHRVIDQGPYGVIRHPGYLGGLLGYLGLPAALGSWWAYIPTGGLVFVAAPYGAGRPNASGRTGWIC